ncbi:MAG: hypothetical protein A2745_00125 [Candidatus Harrisonbacteria bacterium RIFCSPHIGHO2_01_FULL_44_13]|uniref:Serine aminopeptidase S33 domain-containing protein n=1 Tax=Candidatus Harrisonbacteria bacterium RIFCSPLOWO2_01_FULL_44_18 TaxID=1798407 RepID=A0A1G1ZMP5_9BACT|nr:MAG: hypothetical protein A2745_00125 [Candidatus Harrisonbacteria bacterium RIFCSPHIGHO2_01_FULL_44_13]OGY65844.1 MAG: hypothetical protein A3A16_02145 [Candidatus Harrisonbacteria bacterium RIFCSPLOWO2_01_FULL_44_18]
MTTIKWSSLSLAIGVIAVVIVMVMAIVRFNGNMFFTAADNFKIAYDLYSAEKPRAYLVLVHMMPAVKESWQDFAVLARENNYSSIAVDLRGHGESDGGPNGYINFSDTEHQKSILDLQTAVDFLKERGASPEKIYFIGASIGANLSLQYLAENPEYKKAVLLSAGLDYRGIKTEPLVKKLSKGQKIMLVSARDDDRSGGNNVNMNEILADLAPKGVVKDLVVYETGGHGTAILENQPDVIDKIFSFLNN